jgi:FkbH-like protein
MSKSTSRNVAKAVASSAPDHQPGATEGLSGANDGLPAAGVAAWNPRNDAELYRAPQDLSVEAKPISRWLVVGSCLASGFPDFVRGLPDGAEGDYVIFNNAANLPDEPPSPVASYDCQFIQIPLRSVVPDLAHARIDYDDVPAFQELLEDSFTRLDFLFHAASKYSRNGELVTFVSNFIVPQQGTLGRVVGRRDIRNFSHFVRLLNERLEDLVASMRSYYVLDVEDVVRSFGGKNFQDDILWQYNHAAALVDNDFASDQGRLHTPRRVSELFSLNISLFILAMWEEIKALYVTVTRKNAVKLVIFDIDDTLWRGVVAELDSPDPSSLEGWPLGVAEAVLYLKQRGVIVAIVSKNDEERIRGVWNSMWMGRLHLEDFAAVKINWNSKAENVAEIIRDVHVLPESVLFVDDNPVERFTVETGIPGVRTIGADLYNVRRVLLWAAETQPAVMTDEAARRNSMIKAQIERESQSKSLDRASFLASLQIEFEEIVIDSADHPRFPRAFELLNKTNQFNTTGKRWSEDELVRAMEDGLVVYAFEVADRFTQYGLVGMALVRASIVEQFVMSCRVIGLDVELQSLERIKARHTALTAEFRETEKNFLCRDLFERAGFSNIGDQWEWRAGASATAA